MIPESNAYPVRAIVIALDDLIFFHAKTCAKTLFAQNFPTNRFHAAHDNLFQDSRIVMETTGPNPFVLSVGRYSNMIHAERENITFRKTQYLFSE